MQAEQHADLTTHLAPVGATLEKPSKDALASVSARQGYKNKLCVHGQWALGCRDTRRWYVKVLRRRELLRESACSNELQHPEAVCDRQCLTAPHAVCMRLVRCSTLTSNVALGINLEVAHLHG